MKTPFSLSLLLATPLSSDTVFSDYRISTPTTPPRASAPPGGGRGLPSLRINPDGSRVRADDEYLRRTDADDVGLTDSLEVSEATVE